jgi:hypothetical protein
MKTLLDLGKRQSAWEQLVASAPEDTFDEWENRSEYANASVSHVIECPQAAGEPMYMVFLDGPEGKPEGWIALIEPDGKGIITGPFDGNNVVDPSYTVADINGDGIVEFVSFTGIGGADGSFTDELQVIPITPEQTPILTILFNGQRRRRDSLLSLFLRDNSEEVLTAMQGTTGSSCPVRPKHVPKGYWFWRVAGSALRGYRLELGPVVKGQFSVEASFSWAGNGAPVSGSMGGAGEAFLAHRGVIPEADYDAFVGDEGAPRQ